MHMLAEQIVGLYKLCVRLGLCYTTLHTLPYSLYFMDQSYKNPGSYTVSVLYTNCGSFAYIFE